MKRPHICFVTAAEITIKVFLADHFSAMLAEYDITAITNTGNKDFLKSIGLNAEVIPVIIERKISPTRDIISLFRLYFLFRKRKFDAIHSITPKAGLLSMLAAFLARVPVRIHSFTGQVWATKKGIARWLLKNADKCIAFCATHILVDSNSQREFLIREGVFSALESRVIANGSICGVDTRRFTPDPEARRNVREGHLIEESDVVFIYVGRLTYDKGLIDLAGAFGRVAHSKKDVHLLIVGPDEENMREDILKCCGRSSDKVHFETYTDKPEKMMAAADVFCLPSYREGFGMTIIEAGSVGVPSIGTRIYGIEDAIEEGKTGFLYTPHDVDELVEKMLIMIEEPDMRSLMGTNARERVKRYYSKEIVTSAFVNFYDVLLNRKLKNK